LMIGTGASTGSLTLKIARVAGRTHNPARAYFEAQTSASARLARSI
jgi:hypothetical protein